MWIPFETIVTPREKRPLCCSLLFENRVFMHIPSVMMTPLSSSLYFLPSGVSLSPFPLLLYLLSHSSFWSSPPFFSPPPPASSLEKRRHFIIKWKRLRLCRIGIHPILYPGQLESSESLAQISNGKEGNMAPCTSRVAPGTSASLNLFTQWITTLFSAESLFYGIARQQLLSGVN